MNQQPDKIFREKLEHHQRNAPAPVWERIETGLDKKERSAWPWLRAAAAILLLALGAWIFWPSHNTADQTKHTAKQNNTTHPKTNSATPKESTTEQSSTKTVAPPEKESRQHEAPENNAKATSDKRKKERSTPITPLTNPEAIQTAENNEGVKQTPSVDQSTTTTSSQNIAMSVVEEEQNIKLVYAANASEKYLKKTVSDEATSDEKKTSRLQRLLDKAEDLTTNQDPIGDLRQAKNEILALNFRSEKDRGQNK